MRNIKSKFWLAAFLFALTGWMKPAQAFVVHDPGLTMKVVASEAARLGQTATMITNQINMYANMVSNTLSLRDTAFAPLGNMLRSLDQVYRQGQSLMYRAQNLDQQFGYMYPSYSSIYSMGQGGTSMTDQYRRWSDQRNESLRTALNAAGIQANAKDSDDAMLQRLMLRSATAGGQKAALQAGNEIAALNVQQLQRLQLLIEAQMEMQIKASALENQRQSVYDAWTERYRRTPVTNSTAKDY